MDEKKYLNIVEIINSGVMVKKPSFLKDRVFFIKCIENNEKTEKYRIKFKDNPGIHRENFLKIIKDSGNK